MRKAMYDKVTEAFEALELQKQKGRQLYREMREALWPQRDASYRLEELGDNTANVTVGSQLVCQFKTVSDRIDLWVPNNPNAIAYTTVDGATDDIALRIAKEMLEREADREEAA